MESRSTFLHHFECVITRRGDAGAQVQPGDWSSRSNVVDAPRREKAGGVESGVRGFPSGDSSGPRQAAEKSLGGECMD